MNYSTAIFLVNKSVRAVQATYDADGPNGTAPAARTMFKTFDESIMVGDLVVVPTNTRHLMTICKVVEVDVEVDFDNPTPVAWIVDKVDRAGHDGVLSMEAAAVQAIKSAEVRRKREELADKLLADMDPEAAARLQALNVGDAPALAAPPAA